MLTFVLDNFWLLLYVGASQAVVADYAYRNKKKLTPLSIIFMLILAPTWPLFLLFFLFKRG